MRILLLTGLIAVVGVGFLACEEEAATPTPTAAETPTRGAFTPSGPAAEIPEATRRQIFYDLVAAQGIRGIADEQTYEVIAQQYGISVDAVREIVLEGVTKSWPMPTPSPP